MNESISKEIDIIKENLNILPKKTKDNISKYNEYIDDKLSLYNNYLSEIKKEINYRVDSILKKYMGDEYFIKENKLDVSGLKFTNKYIDNIRKMNLDIYFYQLNHFYNNDLDEVNIVINKIIDSFKKCGIVFSSDDFIVSPAVKMYLVALLDNKNNLHELFEKLYWENSNLIFQIEINFRYLYFKYEKKICKFYEEEMLKYNLDSIIDKYNNYMEHNNKIIHNNTKFIVSSFLDGKDNVNDFKDSNISNIINNIIIEEDNATYCNLLKLKEFVTIYSKYLNFSFIIQDIKDRYNNINNFKNKYATLLKDISKNESSLISLNKKIDNKGIFKLKDSKIKELIIKRNDLINDIINKYKELDDYSIYEMIIKNIDSQSSYLDILKMVCFNFTYLIKVYKSINEDITQEEVLKNMEELIEFVYGFNSDLLGNIFILEDKNIPLIIRDRFRLVKIRVQDEDLELDRIGNFIIEIDKIIKYYDINNNDIKIDELEFIIKTNSI